MRRRDFWLGVVALAGVLALGVLRGVLVAVVISLLVLLHELNHPRSGAAVRAPGLLAVRPEERLYFANARRVCDRIAAMVAAIRPPPAGPAGAGGGVAGPLPAGLAAGRRAGRPDHLGAGRAPGDRLRPDRRPAPQAGLFATFAGLLGYALLGS